MIYLSELPHVGGTYTKALRRRRYWLIAASTIDRLVKLRSIIRRVLRL